MDREQARQTIRAEWRKILETITGTAKDKANGETSYICPICGHGKDGDGLTRNKGSRDEHALKCFGCGFSGDIIRLYMQREGKEYNEALRDLAGIIGETIDPYIPAGGSWRNGRAQNGAERPQDAVRGADNGIQDNAQTTWQNGSETPTEAAKQTADFTAYYTECRKRIRDPRAVAYLQGRGISIDTAEAYWIGFDPEADPANAPGATSNQYKPHPAPRIIFPTSAAHYAARSIDPETPKQYQKMNPNKEKGAGEAGIFNKRALYSGAEVVFITEGAFNALSIIEAGGAAIATNSAANLEKLLEELRKHPTKATLILAFDNDKAGRAAAEKIRPQLQKLNISYILAGKEIIGRGDETPAGEDANDLLRGEDREQFIAAVRKAQQQFSSRPDNTEFYINNLMGAEAEHCRAGIRTGFDNLDAEIHGLYPGLYVIAAISSLGKTTFTAQMADQIAATGQDVLFFSLEQSRLELVSKSIARMTYKQNKDKAVTSLAIRQGNIPGALRSAVAGAIDRYTASVKDRISIIEGNFNCDVSFIGEYIRRYIRRNPGKESEHPVVIIDYLQVLQPGQQNGRLTMQETIDASVTELKRISRELDITIFVISSVNRANYLTPIDFESLKHSGGIEYTADVIWGLQLQCLGNEIFNKNDNTKARRDMIRDAKKAPTRKIELLCLKNRYGVSSFSVYFDYHPANDYFEPGIKEEQKK